jgi:hypothetical protein
MKYTKSYKRWKLVSETMARLMVVECTCAESVRDLGESLPDYEAGRNSACPWHGDGTRREGK